MTRIIAIANQKGGVGKTTTAINLSSALAHFGRKVLLLDMDPQGNAGRGLGVDINLQKHTIYEVIAEGLNPTQAILTTSFEGVDVIPANLRLAQFEGKNEGGVHPFSVLKNALAKLPKDHYDYIVVDCPPSLGLLCLNSRSSMITIHLFPSKASYSRCMTREPLLAPRFLARSERPSKRTPSLPSSQETSPSPNPKAVRCLSLPSDRPAKERWPILRLPAK